MLLFLLTVELGRIFAIFRLAIWLRVVAIVVVFNVVCRLAAITLLMSRVSKAISDCIRLVMLCGHHTIVAAAIVSNQALLSDV